jgi:hypothetical protein
VQQVEQAREVLDTWVRSAGAEAEGLLALREGVEGGGGGGAVTLCGGGAAAEARGGAGGGTLLLRGDRTLALAMSDVQLTGAICTFVLVQQVT